MSIINITVLDTLKKNSIYSCSSNWNATKAALRIREEHGMEDGSIKCNGIAIDDENEPFSSFLTEDDKLTFENGIPRQQQQSINSTISPNSSINHVGSFEDAINILMQNELIYPNAEYSFQLLQRILGCATFMQYQGREGEKSIAINHAEFYSQSTNESKYVGRTQYFVVVGSSGSGKTRFMYEVGNELQQKNYLVLATTFNHDTRYTPEDNIGLEYRDYPIVARLLFQYAYRKSNEKFSNWCKKLANLNNTYDNLIKLLTLMDVVKFLKMKFSKDKAVLLIDETYKFIQMKKYNDIDIQNLMSEVVLIQDYGISVIFSAFVGMIANRESHQSSRNLQKISMNELSYTEMTNITNASDYHDLFNPILTALGMERFDLMKLLYSCIGGLPRVLQGLLMAVENRNNVDLLPIIDAVGIYIAKKYYPPSFDLIMAAFSNKDFTLNSVIKTQEGDYTIETLKLNGFCTTSEDFEDNKSDIDPNKKIRINISYAFLFSAVYSIGNDSTCPNDIQQIFRHVLRQLLLTPLIKNHNIWEEFMRRLVILRSLNYSSSTNIPLVELFDPSIQVNNCLTNTHILMNQIHHRLIRYTIPPSPTDVKNTPSIWFPDNQFESGVDTLIFFQRTSNQSTSAQDIQSEMNPERNSNVICVGIQNKWYRNDRSKISYSTMRDAVNHFTSKMRTLGWNNNQLFFLFIINQSIHKYVKESPSDYFNEQIGIISTTGNMLNQWLSPSVKPMVERFQALAKRYPDHEVFEKEISQEDIEKYNKDSAALFKQLKDSDLQDDIRSKRLIKKKRNRDETIQHEDKKRSKHQN